MNCKHSLIALLSVLALLLVAGGAMAGEPSRSSPMGRTDPVLRTAGSTFAHFFLVDPTTSTAWWRSSTAVDTSGGVHVAFYDTSKIYYAYCAANCNQPDNWLELPLFDVGTLDSLDEPTLSLDPSGHPRLMWYAEYNGDTHYYYAECNANCIDSSGNWTSVAVASLGGYGYPHNTRYGALDTHGRPRLVYAMSSYPDDGFYYLTCDASCTTASNWQTTTVTTTGLSPNVLQLVFDRNDRPRVLGHDDNNLVLVYAECDSDCSVAANWGSVPLFNPVYGLVQVGFALEVDTQGRPRIAYYQGSVYNNVLNYAWSNSNPLTAAGWLSYTLNYPTNTGDWSLDLALDSQDRPRVTFATDKLDLSYLTCTANCESTGSTWQQQFIETSDELNATYPIPTSPGCLSSTWMVMGYPSLALDAANNPHVSYYVKHAQLCKDSGGSPQILYDAKGIRLALPGGSSTPTPPASVALNGSAIGVVGISYTFTATVEPITATVPITYVWQATGQAKQTHAGHGASDTASFTWPAGTAGNKIITVTATNAAGTKTGSHAIGIFDTPLVLDHWVYLPLVRK